MLLNQLKHIYYIDDDEEMLLLIKTVLESNPNINIRIFTSPETALTEIRKNKPDLVILDYQMPKMNGIQVMKQIQQMKIDVPVVFFTAQSSPEEIQKFKQLGAAKVITKPLEIDELANKLISI